MGVEAATVTRRMPPVLNPPHPVMVWSCLTRSAHTGGVLGQIPVPLGKAAKAILRARFGQPWTFLSRARLFCEQHGTRTSNRPFSSPNPDQYNGNKPVTVRLQLAS